MEVKEEKFRLLIECLAGLDKKVASMESCTGGLFSNSITNVIGSSQVFEYGIVTYSNKAKIDMGISKDIINKHNVYSKEVALLMAKRVTTISNANYGIGITGKLNSIDNDNITYICIYDKDNDIYYENTLSIDLPKRSDNKVMIVNFIVDRLLAIIIKNKAV